jgi:hypothetical protein
MLLRKKKKTTQPLQRMRIRSARILWNKANRYVKGPKETKSERALSTKHPLFSNTKTINE